MKKVIIAISIVSSIIACKKKKDENPSPSPVPVVESPTVGANNSNCQAKSIKETAGNSVSDVTITYNGSIPASIRVDSNNVKKIDLVLDDKGSIKSGTIPITYGGSTFSVDFKNTNTYNSNGLLEKSVFVSTNIPLTQATIINNYSYDNYSNLVILTRSTEITNPLSSQNTEDIINFSGYVNGRPLSSSKSTKDIAANTPQTKI